MQKEILDLFLNKHYSPYDIHMKLGCSLKEVYHFVKQSEEAKFLHNKAVKAQRLLNA